ncbi:conserved hypothetical protein [Sporisorium reilianum SRZ2]|uniref:Uncharacterized protein n=1 Tax=Sporisorium reilianum (strain SRZ2) TaxID=999809 RepID=E6ZQR4_SPORE|nr:conserved hypothetical protein [Sporisorium reilianum SRZ2]
MKRTYPYSGPGSQAQGAPPPAYGQPPPPAGPAPPLPASGGASQAAYANYGYGSVAPPRHAAAPLNGAGANDAQQAQWNQPWSQPQQPYYPPQQPNAVGAPGAAHFAAPRPPSQAGPYRGVAAPNAGASQNAAYSPHHPQQSVSYPYQPQAPLQQPQLHQPPAPSHYGYAPSMPPHQNAAPSSSSNNNAQSWPGAYAPGTQGGPPNKKPRYQASPNPVPSPVAPYGPAGGAPMLPGNAMGPYPPQQPYGWQGPNAAPAPHMNAQPVPGHPAQHGRVPSGSGIHANAPGNGASFASPARNGHGAASGRGMSRNGAQNRANMQQGAVGQRAGLPANPTASVNTARAPHGQTRAWGSKASAGSALGAGNGIQAGRRVSSASSVLSDKNAAGGSAKKQGMVPPDAPRGPNNARNNAASAGSQSMKNGNAAAAQGARGSRGGAKDAGAPDAAGTDVKDNAAGSKRAHTDFRILGLEIKQLDWSWFAPQALAEAPSAPKQGDDTETEGAAAAAATASASVEDALADAESAEAKTSAQDDEGHDDQAKETDERLPTAEDEHANDQTQEDDAVNIEHDEGASDAEDDADHDDDADADADGDGDQDADGDLDADAEDDVAISYADTDTVISEQPHSVAPTPEPSSEASKAATAAAQQGKAAKAERAKTLASMRDSTKLRLCFAAMSNADPEGAPTGPKAEKVEAKIEAENGGQGESLADPSEEVARETAAGEGDVKAEEAAAEGSKQSSMPESKEDEVPTSSDNIKDEAASASEPAPPAPPAEGVAEAVDAETEVKEEEPVQVEEQPKAEQDAKEADNDAAASNSEKPPTPTTTEPQAKGPPQLSLNRIFLSFAANRKRLAIDAEAVKSVRIHRSERWIEIRIDASRPAEQTARKKGEAYLVCRGTLFEKRAKGQENYTAVTRADIAAAWEAAQPGAADGEHLELPPFFRLPASCTDVVLHVHLDAGAPLPEPAWLRRNDVAELLAGLQRGSSSGGVAGAGPLDPPHVWAGKIEVLDPEPPPSMRTFLYEWVKESFIGSQRERRRFVDQLLGRRKRERTSVPEEALIESAQDEKPPQPEHAAEEDETDAERDARVARAFIEIVTRLIKGERVTASATLTRTSYTQSTTYAGVVVLGVLELALCTAADAARVRARVDALLMHIPRAVLVKAVDLTWRDVVEGERKGAGGEKEVRGGAHRGRGQHGRQAQHQHQRIGGAAGGGGGGARHGKRKRG